MTKQNNQKEIMSSEGVSASADSLRHYYLESMGIQSWQLYAHAYQEMITDEQSPLKDLPLESPVVDFPGLQSEISACKKCEFSNSEKQAVAGNGNDSASLMIIVLLPQSGGEIFTVSEKTLLSKMLKAIDIDINDVFITPLLKCPQPTTCTLTAPDVQTCASYIKQQIAFIQPSLLFVMGEAAAQCLLNTTDNMDDLRIQDNAYQQIPLMISYSPNDLLQQPTNKKKAWADLQRLQKRLL